MNRREALAAIATTAALPLLHGCNAQPASAPIAKNPDADALALLDQIGENYLRFNLQMGKHQ